MSGKDFTGVIKKVDYKKSSIGDSKFDPVIKWVADRLGKTEGEIKNFAIAKAEKTVDDLNKTEGTGAMVDLEYQNQMFGLIQQAVPTIAEEDRLFNPRIFMDMLDKVLMGSKRFNRISNAYNPKKTTPKMTYHPSVGWDMMVEEGLVSKGAIPKTAWCDPKCIIAFGRDFTEALLQYGEIVGIESKDADYQSNGGSIPDGYSFVEFVIAHELLHYTNGDHIYPERYKVFKKLARQRILEKLDGKPISDGALEKRVNSLTHQTINWLGDFINNHQLIKAGYEQIPLGLFSEKINADQGKDYFELYEDAMEMMISLKDETKEEKQEQSDQHMEDGQDEPTEHGDDPSDGDDGEGQQGESDPFADPDEDQQDDQGGEGGEGGEGEESDDDTEGDGKGQGGEDSDDDSKDDDSKDDDGKGDGKGDDSDDDSKGDEEDGKGKGKGSDDKLTEADSNKPKSDGDGDAGDGTPQGDGKKGSEFTEAEKEELEKLNREMEQQFDNDNFEKENNGVDIDAKRKQAKEQAESRKQEVNRLQGEKSEEARLQKIAENAQMKTPNVGWKEIIKRMASGVLKKEEVWSKMHRTTTANLGSGASGGTFMRPGEKREKSTNKKKLVFLIDTSYSVGDMMKSVNMQILKTIKAGKLKDCYIMRFSDTEELYHLDIKTGKGYRAKNEWKQIFRTAVSNGTQELDKAFKTTPIKFSEILSTQQSGGTTLSSSTVNLLRVFAKLEYDVLMFTDSDICWSGNVENFRTICTDIFKKFTKKNFSVILSEDYDYDNVVRALGYGEGNRWLSTFKKETNIERNGRVKKGHFS